MSETFKIVKLLDPIQMTIDGTFTPKGAYDNGTDYGVGDMVSYNGSSYIMYTDAVAGTLPTDSSKWGLVASKGNTGATGATGAGVPTGGTTGQVLAKNSNTDNDTEWVDAATTYTDEMAQDAVGVILTDSSEIDFTYDDATPSITATIKSGAIDEAKLDASTNASLDLADTAIQDLADLGITASAAELNTLDGITASTAELNHTDGVTGAIQTQLDAKAPKASPTFTGTVTLPTGLTGVVRADSGVVSVDTDVTDIVSAASDTAAGKVELATTAETTTGTDATRAVTPDGLHDMTSLAGAAWFLDEDDMASNSATKVPSQQSVKAYVDASAGGGGGTVEVVVAGTNIDVDSTDPANPIISVETLTLADVSDITASASEVNTLDGITATTTELNYTDGVTSAIQTQLDAKAADNAVVKLTGAQTVAGVKTFSSDPIIPDEAYGVGWNGVLEPPTKNAVYDKIESLSVGSGISEEDALALAVSL